MTEFNKGWWNCFITFTNEINIDESAIINILKGAGVDYQEINTIIEEEEDTLKQNIIEVLIKYQSKLISE